MKSLSQWLEEYSVSHTNSVNQLIHKICVPLIEFSLLGIFWLIPTPELFWNIPYLNWATLFSFLAMVFYISLQNLKYLLGSLLMLFPMLGIISYLKESYGGIIIYGFVAIFILSWIGQFIGHKIEGKKPSFFKDLFFLLIGPLWVLKAFYQKIGLED